MINYHLVENSINAFVECLPDGGQVQSEQDALDLVGACGEYQAHRLLLHAANLGEDFYDLKTGLAGAVLLKFSNYRIKAAIVVDPERMTGRFGEMAGEANRRNRDFHVFHAREDAVKWLIAE